MTRFRKLTRREIERAGAYAWYILKASPQREYHVQRILTDMGITAFVPSEWRWRKKSRHAQPTKTSYPAYKSVVFVGQGSKVLPWWKFEENHLIIGCYAHPVSGLPRQIATEDIKQVMRAAKTPLFELHDEPEGEAFVYQAGDLVRITDGLMNGEVMSIAEVVDGVAKFYREMMGKRLEISVPVDGLELQHRAA